MSTQEGMGPLNEERGPEGGNPGLYPPKPRKLRITIKRTVEETAELSYATLRKIFGLSNAMPDDEVADLATLLLRNRFGARQKLLAYTDTISRLLNVELLKIADDDTQYYPEI